MTPEELKEFREWCRTFEVSADSMIMKALTHIDQQATALDEAEALTRRNVELINGYMARITELEAQVAALQEIAVGLVATSEYETENWSMRMIPWEEISVEWAEHYKNKACRQLAKEHPEAFR